MNDGLKHAGEGSHLQLKNADGEDFRAVQRLLEKALYRTCPQWLQSEVEDLVQEAMIKLMKMLEASDQPMQVNKTYIKRMAHSITIDEIRKRQRRPEQGTEAGGEAEQVADIERDESAQRDTANSISECISEQLPDRQRAVTLHLIGHTVAEIARMLDCKAKRAENMVYRGVKQLRECLQAKGVHP